MSPRSRTLLFHLLSFVLFAVAIILLYANTFSAPFYFDDKPNIVLNPYLRIDNLSWENIKLAAIKSPNGRRWLPNVTFALNHYFDAYDVWGYHLVNTLIHVAAAFTFYLLAHTTLSLPIFKNRYRKSGEIALAAALIWALHPLQTNAVTYIVQRMTSMGALFYLLALYCYVKARLQVTWRPKILLFILTIPLAAMAILSKENSGMFPIAVVLYELCFLSQLDMRLFKQKRIILITLAGLLLFLFICYHFLGSNPLTSIFGGYGRREFTLGQRLLSQTRIIIHYLSLLILPLPSRLNLMYEYQLSTGLFSPPQTLMALGGLAGMTLFAFTAFRKERLFCFAILWFLINLAIESSFIPLELVYEHRMYVPAMFLILATVAWFYRFTGKRVHLSRIAMFLVLLLLSGATWQRNTVWGNPISFWSDVARKSPNTMRAWGNLGNAYGDAQKYKIAEEYLLKALDLEKNDKSGNFGDEALENYTSNIHDNLALVYHEVKQYKKAIDHANLALTINPSRPQPLVTLGIVYSKTGEYGKAYQYFMLAWSKGIESVDLYNNWAVSAFTLGSVDEAIDLLHKALKIDPDHPDSHYNLGIAYSSKGLYEEAQREMLLAMQLRQKK